MWGQGGFCATVVDSSSWIPGVINLVTSAWYSQGLFTTTGLSYWAQKSLKETAWSLFLPLRSPQRAPTLNLPFLLGSLSMWTPLSCPGCPSQGPGCILHYCLCSSSLKHVHMPSPITPVSWELWNPLTPATATISFTSPLTPTWIRATVSWLLSQPNRDTPWSFPCCRAVLILGWVCLPGVHAIRSLHDLKDFQWHLMALRMKSTASAHDLAPIYLSSLIIHTLPTSLESRPYQESLSIP